MITDELVAYIMKRIGEGAPEIQIRTELQVGGNWATADIDEGFEKVKQGNAPQPAAQEVASSAAVAEPVPSPGGRRKIMVGALAAFAILLVAGGAAWYFKGDKQNQGKEALVGGTPTSTIANADVPDGGSAKYDEYKKAIDEMNAQLLVMEEQMKAQGSNQEDIDLAKREFIEFIGTTWLMQLQLDSSLSDEERQRLATLLVGLVSSNKDILTAEKKCPYTEVEKPLPDFLAGATLKFKKPMVYIDDEEADEEDCSPTVASAVYDLWPAESWNSIHFDKSKIKERPISATTTFTVLKVLNVKRGGLFAKERDHYVLRDGNGVVTVPSGLIFDADYEGEIGESGSEVYRNGKYVGHVVRDTTTGIIWIQGTKVPQEVVEANTPKKPTTFSDPISRRYEFLERVALAIDEGMIADYTNKELIDNDLGKGLYTYRNGEVINDYGGRVYVKKSGSTASVVFEGIPNGEDCYEFYFINDPFVFGFDQSYIDGVLEDYDNIEGRYANDKFAAFKKMVCYPEKGTVTIEFRGSIDSIREKAAYVRNAQKPRY